jgi:P4 family phage/plasmid primase-like protien
MSLGTFLKKYQVSEAPYSHVTYIGGKYRIPKEQYSEFCKLYFSELVKGKKNYIVERHLDKFNYFQDVDSKDDTITDSDIKEIILATLEKIPSDTDYIVSKRNTRYHINYCYQINPITALEITESLVISSDLKRVMDLSVYKNKGLRMLGSFTGNKEKDTSVYKVYSLETKQFTEFNALDYSDFEKTLMCSHHGNENMNSLKGVQNNIQNSVPNPTMDGQVNVEITKFLSDIKNDNVLKKSLPGVEHLTRFDLTPQKIKFVKNPYSGLTKFYVSIKDNFCPFKHRIHKRDTNPVYLEMSAKGICLRCYDDSCKKEIFPSEAVTLPFDYPEFSKKYNLLSKYLTVKYYTSEVDMDRETREVVEKSISGTHFSVAKVIFHLCKKVYRIDEMKNTEWYHFNGVRWVKSLKLHLFISEDLPKYYRSVKIKDTDGKDDNDNDNDNDMDESETLKYNKLIDKLINKLETSTFKKAVLEELKYMFFDMDNEFITKLDSNVNLIGFENGVYDFKTLEFRDSKPEDYVSYTTGYDYIPYDPENPKVKEINEFVGKIITNKDVREYTLKVLGRSLLGVPDEKFYIWTGLDGSNGKSTLVSLLERTLGDYAITCDTTLLTGKRTNSSSASPDAYEMRGRRLLFFAEPEKNASLRVGFMKQMTGGDTIKARELFKSIISFKSQGTFVMCTNELPKVDASDGGTWRRIRVAEFTSRFCLEPTKPNEFKIDPDLKEKSDSWMGHFMSVLVHYYGRFKKEGNKEPKEVLKATNSYKGDNDNFDEFFVLVKESKMFTPIKVLYDELANWWSENYPKTQIPSVLEAKRALRLRFGAEVEGKVDGRVYKGFFVEVSDGRDTNECELDDY